jgi:hypothetical protein
MDEPLDRFLPPLDNSPDPEHRRDFLKKVGLGGALVAGAAVGGPIVGATAAHAAPGEESGEFAELSREAAAFLPSIGAEIECSCNAFGATLFVALPPPLPTLNFIGKIVVKVLIGGIDFVRLQILNHTVRAEHPLFGGITIKLPDIDLSPMSILKFAGPGSLIQTMFMSFTITFDKCGPCEGPFTLQTLEPAKLIGNLTRFPPPIDGITYGLANTIKLGKPEGGDDALQYARFKKFDILVAH